MNLVQGNLNVTRTVSKIALKAEPLVDGLWYRSNLGFYWSQLAISVQHEKLFSSLNQSEMLIIETNQDTSLSMSVASFLSSIKVVFSVSIF